MGKGMKGSEVNYIEGIRCNSHSGPIILEVKLFLENV